MLRRLLTFGVLLALAVPAAASARLHGISDGTLSVREGRGVVIIQGRGAVIGSLGKGSVTISDPIDGDGTGPIVTGDDFPPIDRSDTTTTWRGTKVRFRLIGGTFKMVVRGRGINLSFVGKGSITLNGAGSDDDGSYAVNGGDYSAIPVFAFPFQLSSATNP